MPSSFTQPTPPTSPGPMDVWFNTSRGLTFVWTVGSNGHGAWVEAYVPGSTTPPQAMVTAGPPSLPSQLATSNPNPVVYAAPTPPIGPNDCDLWYDTITGFFFIRYNDGNSVQWVVTNPGRGGSIGPPGPQGDPALLNIPAGTYGDNRNIVVIEVTDDPNQIASMTPVEVDAPTVQEFSDFSDQTLAALALKAPLDSPALTGGPTAPTPATADNDTSIATTAFVRSAIAAFSPPPDLSPYALINSPTFTGDPKAPTPATSDNDTSIATTAYVKANIAAIPPTSWGSITGVPATFPPTLPIAQSGVTNLVSDLALKAPLASPVFTGNPTAPTPTAGDNDTSIATTAFVAAAVASATSISVGVLPPGSPAANALWWNSETGTLFIYYNDGNTTQWVPASASALSPVRRSKIITATFTPTQASPVTIAYTGVGFRPSSIHFHGAQTGSPNWGFGSSDQNRAIWGLFNNGTAGSMNPSGTFVCGVAAAYWSGTLQSYDADGFTILWTKGGAPGGADYSFGFNCFE